MKWEKEKDAKKEERDAKYKWKQKPPKDGESTTKKVMTDGTTKKYHWCEYHRLWTIHSPKECKRQPTGKHKAKKGSLAKKKRYNQRKNTTNENTQRCFATLGVDFCPSKLGGIVAPVSNIGCQPNVACNIGRLSPLLGYNIGFFLKFDDNVGLKI